MSAAPTFAPVGASASCHVSPPSVECHRPRWPELHISEPAAAAQTSLGLSGLTTMRANAPLSGRSAWLHVAPPSVDLYRPSPMKVDPPPEGFEPSPVPA